MSLIKIITTPFFLNASINCYLIQTSDGFILIDSGRTTKRKLIEKELEQANCRPGSLKLILLTHGDFDHCGNAAYFSKKFGAKIAMHKNDSGMLEYGNMLFNRNKQNVLTKIIFKLLFRLKKSDRLQPHIFVDDQYDLSKYGFEAKVLEIPGHSKGSIGILTSAGELFCGDLFGNLKKPEIWSIIDDLDAAHSSIEKLKSLQIGTVYPGHGRPFQFEEFLATYA